MLPESVPHGRVLSLVDSADDVAGSCATLLSRMPEGAEAQIKRKGAETQRRKEAQE